MAVGGSDHPLASETLCASGFSRITLTPASRQSIASWACWSCGVQMWTTSGREGLEHLSVVRERYDLPIPGNRGSRDRIGIAHRDELAFCDGRNCLQVDDRNVSASDYGRCCHCTSPRVEPQNS